MVSRPDALITRSRREGAELPIGRWTSPGGSANLREWPSIQHPLDLTRTTTLAEVLGAGLDRERGWTMYIPVGLTSFDLATPCLWVFDRWDDVEADALEAGWRPGLGLDELRQVRDNLQQQVARFDIEQLVAATDHYFRNDAFIELT